MQLCVVVPVPDYRVAAASRATDALWPAVLAHQGEALRVVEQGCEVDRVRCGHDDRTSRVRRPPPTAWSHHHIRTRRHGPPSPRKPTRATKITPPSRRGARMAPKSAVRAGQPYQVTLEDGITVLGTVELAENA